MKVTAIFDIGKTNKKFFLFDETYHIVFKESISFNEIKDDDGFPADDLYSIQLWVENIFSSMLNDKQFEITAVNFSAYGASFVHIDENGKVLTPLYNYLKPYPDDILQSFYEKYGNEKAIATATASPASGMLNSGMQLYWLKYSKPEIFKKIRYSLHLPQYFSYLFTKVPISDYTSIGCHTSLWDYSKSDYHKWVYEEGIDKILPTIVPSGTRFQKKISKYQIAVGAGIHDSSAALLPYLFSNEKKFLLISSGTWNVSLNPFSENNLSESDLDNGCLHYMRIDGKPVRSARLFLGNEHNLQTERLCSYFDVEKNYEGKIKFGETIFQKLLKRNSHCYNFQSIPANSNQPEKTDYACFENFDEAYHQLMIELMEQQLISSKMAIGKTAIDKIYVDGGFADNEIFIKLLEHHFPSYEICVAQYPMGSALGAALVISDKNQIANFLKQ